MDGMMADPARPEFMEDAEGRMVPIDKVKPQHLLEDDLVRRIVAGADELSVLLRRFREVALSEVAALVDVLGTAYDAPRGGTRGNITLTSFDGRLRVQVAIGDTLAFGPELQVAKSLIDQCISRWSDGANSNLRTVVLDAFRVGKEGRIDANRVLALRRLAIDDAEWSRAMTAIGDAVRISHSKQYVRVYRRDRPELDFVQVPLDLARV